MSGRYSLHADWLADPPLLTRTYYRSMLYGRVWCESKDPEEVKRMSANKPDCVFEKVEFYEITAGWEEWKP